MNTMRRPLVLVLIALPLIAAPFAFASGALADPVEVTPAPLREGDTLRYDGAMRAEGGRDGASTPSSFTLLIRAEGASRVLDAYGLPRDTVAFLVEAYEGDDLSYAARCHVLSGGRDAVRTDILHGSFMGSIGGRATSTSTLGLESGWSVSRHTNFTTLFEDASCASPARLAERTFREGDRVSLAALQPGTDHAAAVLSAPGVAAEFEGRPAVTFAFDLAELWASGPQGVASEARVEGTVRLTVADGLPGVVLTETTTTWTIDGETTRAERTMRLSGLTAGAGAPLPPEGDARLPETNPDARMEPYDALALDDAAFGFPYAFDEAMRALRADPQIELDAWLDAHPEAWLAWAEYDREGRGMRQSAAPGGTDGAWSVMFLDPSGEMYWAMSARSAAPAEVPALPDGVPDPRVENWGGKETAGMPWGDLAGFAPPARVLSSADALRLARTHGIPDEPVQTLAYQMMPGWGDAAPAATLTLSAVAADGARSEGRIVALDPVRGGARHLGQMVEVRSGASVLDPRTSAVAIAGFASAARGLGAIVPPEVGAGLAAGSVATGVALLLVAAKLALAPLYTRLVRDRLLDNPVRARLYERVRAEPGIRLHELVEFAGVGEGATRRHLDQLARHRFLVEMREGAQRAYYAAGEVPPQVARQAALLRSDTNRRVYELLRAEPHLSLREAGARLGVSAPLVHRAKKKLEAAGLLPAARGADVALSEA